MAKLQHISAQTIVGKLNWKSTVRALAAGHKTVQPVLADQLLQSKENSLLSRSAWIDGLGVGVKSVTVMAENAVRNLPTVQGAMLVFDDATGAPRALIDSDVVTYWKTAGDSVYAASLLARPDSRRLLIVGAGVVAESLLRAYCEIFPDINAIKIWNRTSASAERLASKLKSEGFAVEATADLASTASNSDIICTATMATEPILQGDWINSGTHIDLIGAFRPDMREADDQLLQKGRLFVDCRATTIEHIGELMIPLASGAIAPADVLGDLYDLNQCTQGRTDASDITIFKNGGGAHLDLMTANLIIQMASNDN